MIGRIFLAALLGASLGAQDKPPADPWQPLRFLIGTWHARTHGGAAQAAASGVYTFQLELREHVLARHSSSSGCSAPADFNCEHSDLLYLYRDAPAQPLKAIYFDNEGHVIRYDVATPAANQMVLTSAPAQSAPQFRLSYELRGSVMYGTFQLRMPGQSDFQSYLEWDGGKAPSR